MKVLITGVAGMLGRDVKEVFEGIGATVIGTDRTELDITDLDAVRAFVKEVQPDLVVNTAAYNFVDACEDDVGYAIAYSVNAKGPEHLAIVCAEQSIPLIHYSTDYVFDGTNIHGYREEEPTHPISKYGETKVEGERLVLGAHSGAFVLRLSKLFGRPGVSDQSKPSFVSTMLQLAKTKPNLQVVHDEYGCPTYTPDVAQATLELVKNNEKPGIYHVVNVGKPVTWYEYAKEIFDVAGISVNIEPVAMDAYPRPARRPHAVALLNTKLAPLPDRKDALRRFLS